jgi:hypothetical protein
MYKNKHPHTCRAIAAAACLSGLCAGLPLVGADMGGIAIHGSLSTTASYSPDYNYIGDTKDSLDLNQNELIVNGTKRFENGIKLAAQLYAYELAGYEDMTVDFANIDYSFRQEIGVRIGRNKMPVGLYNEVQDLDQVRTFASLPLNFYARAGRAIGSAYDGGAIYGNIPAGKAGSFDYQVFVGTMPSLDERMPIMKGIAGATKLDLNTVYGASLVWNAPVEGLRLGYTYQALPQLDLDVGPAITEVDYENHVFSVEYTRGKWTAAAEYKYTKSRNEVTNFPVPPTTSRDQHSYVQLTYQATDKLGLGVYYGYSDFDGKGVDKDTAFAAAYALQPWWLVKAEVHFMDGINNLGNAGDSNPGATDDTWTYFVLKSTLSF